MLWAAGIALRFRSLQAGPLMQTPVFMIIFLAPVYVPIDLLHGWVEAVAHVNPITPIVEARARHDLRRVAPTRCWPTAAASAWWRCSASGP